MQRLVLLQNQTGTKVGKSEFADVKGLAWSYFRVRSSSSALSGWKRPIMRRREDFGIWGTEKEGNAHIRSTYIIYRRGERHSSGKKSLLGHALDQCAQCERVVTNVLKRKCELETHGNDQGAERCVQFSIAFRKEIKNKLDAATKHIISCAEEFMGPKHEVNVSEANSMGVQYGIWCNITQRPFRMKVSPSLFKLTSKFVRSLLCSNIHKCRLSSSRLLVSP